MTDEEALHLVATLELYRDGRISTDDIERVLQVLADLHDGPVGKAVRVFQKAMTDGGAGRDRAAMTGAIAAMRGHFKAQMAAG